MPLTKGQKIATYLLLTSRSQMRFSLEGLIGDHFGTPGGGAVQNLQMLLGRLDSQLKLVFGNITLDHTALAVPQLLLPAIGSVAKSGGITTDHGRIRTAIGLDGVYDPMGDPCPADASTASGAVVVTNDQTLIVRAILGVIP